MTPRERLHVLREAHEAMNPKNFDWHTWYTERDCGTFACVLGNGALDPRLQKEGLSLVKGQFMSMIRFADDLPIEERKDFFGLTQNEYEALVFADMEYAYFCDLISGTEREEWQDYLESHEPGDEKAHEIASIILNRLCKRYPLC